MGPCPSRGAGMCRPQKRGTQPMVTFPWFTMYIGVEVLHKSQHRRSAQTARKIGEIP